MDSALRPMSASQVLDRTFYLYRRNFWLFAGIAMIAPALSTIANLGQLWMLGFPTTPDPTKVDPAMMQHFFADMVTRMAVGVSLGMTVYAVGYAIASGATVYAVSMLHLGKTTTIQEAYSRIKPIFGRILALVVRIFFIASWPLALSYALMFAVFLGIPNLMKGSPGASAISVVLVGSLLALAGSVAGIIWFFYAYCRYALAVPACTIENLPVKFSLIRSKFLTKGNVGRVLGVYLLTLLIAIAVRSVLEVPAFIASGIFTFRAGAHPSVVGLVWLYAAEFIGTMVAGPIATIAMALVYYDERVRKEAFDLHLMMDVISQTSPVPLPAESVPGSMPTVG